MRLQPVIGLETHVQLKTASKLFCSCSNNSDDKDPNEHVCPVCLGHPGVLPVPNAKAVEYAVKLGLALNGKIASYSKFDRKNYFYPDLPKAYQISQYDLPVMSDGSLEIELESGEKKVIDIERLHLEEDAAKNIHAEDGSTLVDFNRGGTPLCEIVTRPVMRNAEEARKYAEELQNIVRALGVSDADMEKGHLRCDVNISLREVDENDNPVSDTLWPKTEIKNVNSFRSIERAIEYEIKRQTDLWEADNKPMTTVTRGWDDAKQKTTEQRTKEGEADYRYFPEPDIPPMQLTEMAEEQSRKLPELPAAKRERFVSEYEFKSEDAALIANEPSLATFTEHTLSELQAWLEAQDEFDAEGAAEQRAKMTKLFTTWFLTKLTGILADKKIDIRIMKVDPENFAEFLVILYKGDITAAQGLDVLTEMVESGKDPSYVVEELGASRVDDADALNSMIDTVIAENPDEFERLKGGDKKLIGFFMGQIMKMTQGSADPGTVTRLLNDRI